MLVSDDFQPDCSSLACPVGPAFGKLSKNVTAGMHGEECSNAAHATALLDSVDAFLD